MTSHARHDYVVLVNENNIPWAMEMTGKSEAYIRERLAYAKKKRVVCVMRVPFYVPK